MSILEQIPKLISSPSAWIGEDLAARQEEWLIDLTQEEIAEILNAGQMFEATGKEIGDMGAEDFPLPGFSAHLMRLKDKLLNGIGVEVLRGLPVQTLTQKQAAIVFCGIGAHLGKARSQNAMGHILGHVRDLGMDPMDPNARIYQTHARQSFHTDSSDVVGLLCLNDAKEGGDSLLVSAETIYNEMREGRPDLLELLFDPIATDRRGEIPEGMMPYMTIPPLSWHDGKLTVFYQRQYIDSAQRFADAMRLTPAHIDALDMFDHLANDPRLHIRMRLQPGDMQFVYNHSQLHDRTAFTDWPERENRRHLFRLWLSLENDRALPECFKQRYGTVEIGNRGGIIVTGTKLHVPLDEPL